ncbi:MAG: tetratricopeptide repeat protein [Planctomycetota bacterium]
MSKEQAYSLFSQANQSFREANSAKNPQQAEKLYEKAILAFKRIINEGRIKNAKLYYNLANAYFLKGDIGNAILNYRRAEKLDDSDANIQKNLTFARGRRIDKVVTKTEKRVLQTLLSFYSPASSLVLFVYALRQLYGLAEVPPG